MRRNNVKQVLKQGGVAIGTMVFEFNTAGIGSIIAAAGADFAIFDMEHTGWSVETVRSLIATSKMTSLVPMVRVPANQYPFISRVLDVGAMGIMVPMVENSEQALHVVQCAKYPPLGRRGAAFGIAHDDYKMGDVAEEMRLTNQEILIIAQIETAQGVENVEKIAAVDGIDVLWIGHFDLTASMGIPGQFDHPNYLSAVDRVLEAGQLYGKAIGFMASSVEEGQTLLEKGFRCLAYWGDLWIYSSALAKAIAILRARVAI